MNPTPSYPTGLSLQSRRTFLGTAIAAAGATAHASAVDASAAPRAKSGLIDVNVSLGQWPVRRTRCDDPRELVARLRRQGVSQAWAGTLEGLLHKDIASA